MAVRLSGEERGGAGHDSDAHWATWVTRYLDQRYQTGEQALTRLRYANAWAQLETFLAHQRIQTPRQLQRQHCFSYPDWRMTESKANPRPVQRNTAITELKLLALLMDEAIQRGFAEINPAKSLRLRQTKPERKPEITVDDERRIRAALQNEPEDMQVQFVIGINHGCRLRETRIDLDTQVDWARGLVTFRTKGGERLTVPMAREVHELLVRRKKAGHRFSCEVGRNASKKWCQFFDRIGLPHLVFHCCRVTVSSRLHRLNVHETKVRAFVGHRSERVHALYVRVAIGDLVGCLDALASYASVAGEKARSDAAAEPRLPTELLVDASTPGQLIEETFA